MDEFIQLTDWETERPVFVRPSAVLVVRQLAAQVFDSYGSTTHPPHECGERTRIDTETDCMLVRESANEIMEMIFQRNED